MYYDVIEARHVRDYVVWLRFRDGLSGEVDLESLLKGPVFQPLRNLDNFRLLFVHPECATLAWPNDVDVAPETLHARVAAAADDGGAASATSDPTRVEARQPAPASPLRRRPAHMPEISRFFGIVISMFYSEHGLPHFHARTGEHEVSVEIGTQVVRGEFPGRSLRLVLDWEALHRDELAANWERARQDLPLLPVAPLR